MSSKIEAMLESIRKDNWDVCDVSKKGFKGAVKEYENSDRVRLAVAFNLRQAMIIDEGGDPYPVNDIDRYIIKSRDFDINEPQEIKGVQVLAYICADDEGNPEVEFNDEKIAEYKLDDLYLKRDISTRLLKLYQLDEDVIVGLG